MKTRTAVGLVTAAIVAVLVWQVSPGAQSAAISVSPTSLARAGMVDRRFQSYNVEMIEVTGGRFWRPYGPELDALLARTAASGSAMPAYMNPEIYAHREPLDLSSPRLRALAAALGPAYVRVSGTWANSTYFPDGDQAPAAPPTGFGGVLTRQQWKGVIDFARAVDATIVTSFAISAGTRDANAAWTPDQARRFVTFTKASGGTIAAAEFMNEPNAAVIGGAPRGYDAAAYGRDFKAFRAFIKEALPEMLILGPGMVGESDAPQGLLASLPGMIASRDLMTATGPAVDAVSYHHYGALSKRCAPMMQTTAAEALTEDWLTRPDRSYSFVRRLRDELDPGKPIWLTETADAACGGNPWGSYFLDSFRYLDQAGRLAKQGLQVLMHNTLVASAYGMIDERDLTPKPNYWAAVLWRRLMGATVLESGVPIQAGLHVYAHCQRDTPGGVTLLVLNTDKTAPRTVSIPLAGTRYTLSSPELESRTVQLNGATLALGANDALPALGGAAMKAGEQTFAPATITFVALPGAGNAACR